jgi:hypothetical protein
MNLLVVAEFAWDEKRGRKSSSNLRWKFAGTHMTNFGEGWRELRVAARDGVFGSGISTSRRTPAYI